jgi:hypothetical protein
MLVGMHKDELIQLHTLMAQMKSCLEEKGFTNAFSAYDSLAISPVHVHRSKAEHKLAIFVLGNTLASVMSKDDLSGFGKTSERMKELATRMQHSIMHENF